jgi:RNA polymerase sigma-70 factor (ECF subfamily)
MDDKEKALVERILNGDTGAFEPLVTPYRSALLGLAFRMTRNAEDAREVAQEALLRAFRHMRRLDVERSFRNWLRHPGQRRPTSRDASGDGSPRSPVSRL